MVIPRCFIITNKSFEALRVHTNNELLFYLLLHLELDWNGTNEIVATASTTRNPAEFKSFNANWIYILLWVTVHQRPATTNHLQQEIFRSPKSEYHLAKNIEISIIQHRPFHSLLSSTNQTISNNLSVRVEIEQSWRPLLFQTFVRTEWMMYKIITQCSLRWMDESVVLVFIIIFITSWTERFHSFVLFCPFTFQFVCCDYEGECFWCAHCARVEQKLNFCVPSVHLNWKWSNIASADADALAQVTFSTTVCE